MKKESHTLKRIIVLLLSFGVCFAALGETHDANSAEALFEMSIEDLMEIEVTVTSKSEIKMLETPAAVYVVTAEDIRRIGAKTIPDALRIVPGLHVASINSNTWAVSSRGFNGPFANKMLVLIDGRSIYTPLFGGVYWDMHDVMIEDVDRIEVVRGPGGTLWGANAVNGIINVITKSAKDTQGGLISAGGGDDEQGFGSVRYGGKAGESTYYRVWSKYFNRDDRVLVVGGGNGNDGWDVFRSGFRIDADISYRDHFTLQGDFFDGDIGKIDTRWSVTPPLLTIEKGPFGTSGGNILSRWTRTYHDDSQMTLQTYYDRTSRREATFHESRDTYDIDFQHRFDPSDTHRITWGLGYRLSSDNTRGSFDFSLMPEDYDLNVYSAFFQDRISLVQDKLALFLGTKVEYNDFTDFEYQPSARLAYTPDEKRTFWTSVTRAVRTPTRFDRHSRTNWGTAIIGPSVYSVEAYGDDGVESEKVIAYEAGYRVNPADKLFLDFTGFFNRYDNLRTFEGESGGIPFTARRFEGGFSDAFDEGADFVVPFTANNKMDGETYGFEFAGTYQATDKWKLSAAYTFLQMQLHTSDSSTSDLDRITEGESPQNQFNIRSYCDLTDDIELDLMLYYVDNLSFDNVPSYIRFDARLGWHINDNTELSIVGRNLFERLHPEFKEIRGSSFPTESERSFLIEVMHRF